ncbi:MAG: universal stress protein [Candidatus Methanomethylicota archaeon]|uniref:Universal stress protein n=1 Tax=Thermoproteota archaeon TaxID=2056631 RepID=A0A497EZR4_9CREN|nr:MAG: universal stress protein [Candidatus Verstraetearchaeota archaeon]
MSSCDESFMKKIIVAVDGSKCSEYALRRAFQIAKVFKAKVIIAHVIPKMLPYGVEAAEVDTPYHDFLVGEANKVLRSSLEKAKEEGVEAEGKLLEGSPADEVISLAEREGADTIIVGSRGTAVTRAELGSVSERVVRYSPIPVLVIKCPKHFCRFPS